LPAAGCTRDESWARRRLMRWSTAVPRAHRCVRVGAPAAADCWRRTRRRNSQLAASTARDCPAQVAGGCDHRVADQPGAPAHVCSRGRRLHAQAGACVWGRGPAASRCPCSQPPPAPAGQSAGCARRCSGLHSTVAGGSMRLERASTTPAPTPPAQVEEVKMVLRMLPIFFTTMLYWTIYVQMGSMFVQQGSLMDGRVRCRAGPPAAAGRLTGAPCCCAAAAAADPPPNPPTGGRSLHSRHPRQPAGPWLTPPPPFPPPPLPSADLGWLRLLQDPLGLHVALQHPLHHPPDPAVRPGPGAGAAAGGHAPDAAAGEAGCWGPRPVCGSSWRLPCGRQPWAVLHAAGRCRSNVAAGCRLRRPPAPQRIGWGMGVAVVAMFAAAAVEFYRLRVVHRDGTGGGGSNSGAPSAVAPMSILWQGPQYLIVGASEVGWGRGVCRPSRTPCCPHRPVHRPPAGLLPPAG
jgi:hypothetical protein